MKHVWAAVWFCATVALYWQLFGPWQALVIVAVGMAGTLLPLPFERDEPAADWAHADLSKVPPVITQPEPNGDILPWYRRLFGTRIETIEDTPVETYRR